MKILITGAAGFLGYYLALKLSENQADQVICVDNGIRGEYDDLYLKLTERPNVDRFDIDLNVPTNLEELPEDIDTIYHMAALNGTQNFYERPFEVVKCCTLPTLNLLQKFGPGGKIKKFVFAGTSEAYASTVTQFNWEVPTAENVPISIDDIFNPRWSYAASKMHGEIATINGCSQYSIPFNLIRYHNAYGPRMGDKHVIPDFYQRAKNGVYSLYGYEDTRSFMYVDDAVEATIAVASSPEAEGQLVNIGSTNEITIHELGLKMMEVAGLTGEIELHPSPSGSVKRRCPEISKLKRLTSFQERWSLVDGLTATMKFYMA